TNEGGSDDNDTSDAVARLPRNDKFRSERASRTSQRSSHDSSGSMQSRGKQHNSISSSGGSQPGAFAMAGMSSQDNATGGDAFPQIEGAILNEETSDYQQEQEQAVESAPVVRAPSSPQQQHDDNERSAPMVQAELVSPPVEALKVVFDEDHEQQHDVEAHREPEAESAIQPSPDLDKSRPRKRMVIWGIAILVVVLAVVIPVSIVFKKDQENERAATSSSNDDSTKAPLPTFPYECYWTNFDLIGAQLFNPDQKRFIMCPGTHIKIGTMEDPANGNTNITNGDVMMMILRDNVEVVCGEDGNVNNNCVLDGGFLQVLMQSANNNESGLPGFAQSRLDNATIKGMTFTGEIHIDPYVGGASVVASHPGDNIQFVGCKWENLTAATGLAYAGVNPYQLSSVSTAFELPKKNEIDLKFTDCIFRNITYGGGCFINAFDQSITIERCHFSDIRLAPFISRCEGAFAPNAELVDGWCHSLVSCSGDATCTIRDVCVDDFEYAAKSAIVAANYGAEVVLEGDNFFHDLKASYVEESDTCSSGLSWQRDDEEMSSCMFLNDTDATWEFGPGCPL
ncbi:MAG: hypothetical protein SGILL_005534, partial [Bacillariaceae sp.]